MQYVLTFLEGFISFVSPCMLPMIPLYIAYFTGYNNEKKKVLSRSISFVTGFTLVFCVLGVLAGTVGALLKEYQIAVNIVSGCIVVIFGLSYLGVIPLNVFKGIENKQDVNGLVSAFIFGMVFSVSLTPCVGAFLGSALMLAATTGGAVQGLLLLLIYSLGLGLPFVITAVLIDKLKGAFAFVKNHYKIINTICGVFLIAVGLLMAFGLLGKLLSLL